MFGMNKLVIGATIVLLLALAGSGKAIHHLVTKNAVLKEQRQSIYNLYVKSAKANNLARSLLVAREKELAQIASVAASLERKIRDARQSDPDVEAWASTPIPSGVAALVRSITGYTRDNDQPPGVHDGREASP